MKPEKSQGKNATMNGFDEVADACGKDVWPADGRLRLGVATLMMNALWCGRMRTLWAARGAR